MHNTKQWLARRGPVALNKYRRPVTQAEGWILNPEHWLTYDDAQRIVDDPTTSADGYGFALTPQDPYFCIDIDDCLIDGAWSDFAVQVCQQFAGAYVEVSSGGAGLHIFGRSAIIPAHGCVNAHQPGCSKIELYSRNHFAIVSGISAVGSADHDCTDQFPAFCSTYFQPSVSINDDEWTDTPDPEWIGPESDDELIGLAMRSVSSRAELGAVASFGDLWEARGDRLASYYPNKDGKEYDASAADAALAQHLAFWTGRNCERIERIMRRSLLARDKWDDREGYYLPRTITNACAMQSDVFIQHTATPTAAEQPAPGTLPTAKTRAGIQYLTAGQQAKYFEGCVYVKTINKILIPGGDLLAKDAFRSYYGGYQFQMTADNTSPSKNAWEAFTESQVMHFPKCDDLAFRPDLTPGQVFSIGGRTAVNSYYPDVIEIKEGDPSPMLDHLARILPDETDREILLNYAAACVQLAGTKFQWCPILQGPQGVGKTIFAECIEYAIGESYAFRPQGNDLANKFNAWLPTSLFIYIEELRVPEHQQEVVEVMKTLVTSARTGVQPKGVDTKMSRIIANGFATTNYKDAMRIDPDERRYAMFFTAQQNACDIEAAGMGANYFPNLWDWLRREGFAIMAHYLKTKVIPESFRKTLMHRAPLTTSSTEAFRVSLGGIEQTILEAIDEMREGFRGGFVSSVALDILLRNENKSQKLPPNRRAEAMRRIGYVHHPALHDGRLKSPSIIDEGKRPVLYVRQDSVVAQCTDPGEILSTYVATQRGLTPSTAAVQSRA